jgi:nitroimidazol reductase NimA-like FMN-containing flavoprotein (pyridoxamine 5'-phosphate oxidase superfamily)
MRALADGAPVCVTVTALDALKVARSGFESGMRYRSACLFGTCVALAGDEAVRALDAFVDRILPGRSGEVRPSTAKELAATMVLALPITEWSLKTADGFPEDPASDVADDAWAGVVPLRTVFGEPIPNPDLRPGIELPASVRALR